MILFLGSFFFLVLSDFFLLNFYTITILYLTYFFLYFFYTQHNIFIPNYIFLKNFFLNIKVFFVFFSTKCLNLLFAFKFSSLKWKPLFKRSSYFGLYRSIRNQHLNK